MIVGTGIDIAEVPRIARALSRHGDRFLHRVFTEGEIRYCDSKANRIERYAARRHTERIIPLQSPVTRGDLPGPVPPIANMY